MSLFLLHVSTASGDWSLPGISQYEGTRVRVGLMLPVEVSEVREVTPVRMMRVPHRGDEGGSVRQPGLWAFQQPMQG